jgi:calcineurin-like phosphoesterase family protein
MRRILRPVIPNRLPFLVLIAAGLATGCATTAPPPERREAVAAPRSWVALGPQGALARAIVTDPAASCPDLVVDGAPQPMTVRANRPQDFDVLVCEAPLPAGTASASIAGRRLPLPPAKLNRIAVIGDTGCRIKCSDKGCDVQDCNNPKKWPFADVAKKVVEGRPDVVLHVGDYHYREAECPADKQKECGGSPWGDNWPAWQADFFDPATPLLAAAPWVFVRGNHEDCERAGDGWFTFLDPGPPESCNEDPEPYAVSLPGLQLLVLNTSAAGNEPAGFYTAAYATLNQQAAASSAPSWLLSHHPLWAFVGDDGKLDSLTTPLQQDSGNDLDAKVQLVLAGHIHLFEALGFAGDRVPSVVAGMSGTKLDPAIQAQLVGQEIAGATVNAASTSDEFAYGIVEPHGGGWRLTVHDVKGKKKVECEIAGATLSCKDVG